MVVRGTGETGETGTVIYNRVNKCGSSTLLSKLQLSHSSSLIIIIFIYSFLGISTLENILGIIFIWIKLLQIQVFRSIDNKIMIKVFLAIKYSQAILPWQLC